MVFGVLTIRILLFRVLYYCHLFSETPISNYMHFYVRAFVFCMCVCVSIYRYHTHIDTYIYAICRYDYFQVAKVCEASGRLHFVG